MALKLFCVPYAGGSASVYYSWGKYMPEKIVLIPIELAGRMRRLAEPFYDTLEAAADDVFQHIKKALCPGDQYAIFGHSMGSWIAYETARIIWGKRDAAKPVCLFFSGNYAPHVSEGTGKLHLLPDIEFQYEVLRLGRTSEIIFNNEQLCQLFSPIIRADYRILEEYRPSRSVNFVCNCPVSVLCGDMDNITHSQAAEWARYVSGEFSVNFFSGGHFFIHDSQKDVVSHLACFLTQHTNCLASCFQHN